MGDAMATGRMEVQKKARGEHILKQHGLNISQAINLMFDRIIEEESIEFLVEGTPHAAKLSWEGAADFVDALSAPRTSRFDNMSKAQIRTERLKKDGLM